MASPALASRRSRFCFCTRVSIPSVASEDIAEGVVCASLCVEASEKALRLSFWTHFKSNDGRSRSKNFCGTRGDVSSVRVHSTLCGARSTRSAAQREQGARRARSARRGCCRKDMAGTKRCPHGKEKRKWKTCTPCPHGKVKYWYAECNPCPHGRLKKGCADCTPCPHGRVKSNCADCNPCPHGKRKSMCAQCNPCPRGKVKHDCPTCNSCPHGKVKYNCAACKTARAERSASPEVKQEPEIKQEPFTIRGYFGLDEGGD